MASPFYQIGKIIGIRFEAAMNCDPMIKINANGHILECFYPVISSKLPVDGSVYNLKLVVEINKVEKSNNISKYIIETFPNGFRNECTLNGKVVDTYSDEYGLMAIIDCGVLVHIPIVQHLMVNNGDYLMAEGRLDLYDFQLAE